MTGLLLFSGPQSPRPDPIAGLRSTGPGTHMQLGGFGSMVSDRMVGTLPLRVHRLHSALQPARGSNATARPHGPHLRRSNRSPWKLLEDCRSPRCIASSRFGCTRDNIIHRRDASRERRTVALPRWIVSRIALVKAPVATKAKTSASTRESVRPKEKRDERQPPARPRRPALPESRARCVRLIRRCADSQHGKVTVICSLPCLVAAITNRPIQPRGPAKIKSHATPNPVLPPTSCVKMRRSSVHTPSFTNTGGKATQDYVIDKDRYGGHPGLLHHICVCKLSLSIGRSVVTTPSETSHSGSTRLTRRIISPHPSRNFSCAVIIGLVAQREALKDVGSCRPPTPAGSGTDPNRFKKRGTRDRQGPV